MRTLFLLVGALLLIACNKKTQEETAAPSPAETARTTFQAGTVFADNDFDGARLNGFKQLDETTYQALIMPESIPVNNSPWFSFRIWSETASKITLEIAYTDDFKNRYIPKLSSDGVTWRPCDEEFYSVDTISGSIKLELNLSPQKLWVSAQENLNSTYINTWVDNLAQQANITTTQIGESEQGKPISMFNIKGRNPTQSMVIIGRQHPPEVPGGTISLMAFVDALLANTELAVRFRKQFEIIVFPLLNPDGVDNGNWRHNANGQDLNRDWVDFNQTETKTVRDWLLNARERKLVGEYAFGIDFHTSYSGPYLLTLDTIPHSVKPVITNQWIQQIEWTRNEQLDIRPRAQSLPYCYNWLINELGIEAVTYEEGDEIDRAIIKQRAADYANVLMEVLLAVDQ